jgi:hypothetical protein
MFADGAHKGFRIAKAESFCVTCSGSFYLDKNFLNLAYGSADRDRISNAN